ncbi:hypothetical protein BKA70DRAFT_1349984 [Coprinopsis sp. MPI-PUGE-AT-0042]|nr:hypothetical protein BKA70DRAFT_1349984 [Coprinopsis sp. MPI-PUGE-AT-0042]
MKPDPRLSSYLNANHAIPECLLPHLHDFLEDRVQLIQFCDEEIARLEKQKVRLQSQWMAYAALRAPMRRLPPEILAMVMHWSNGGPGSFVGREERMQFLRVRQVSRMWRQTALYTPYLWRFLSINVGDDPDDELVRTTVKQRMDWWFGNAGRGAKVHLDLRAWGNGWGNPSEWIGILRGCEERTYKMATVQIWGTPIVASDITENSLIMTYLKNLSIRQERLWDAPKRPLKLSTAFPSLESLTVRMPPSARPFPISQPLRHARLRFLHLSGLSFSQNILSATLEALPLLEELLIHNCFCEYPVSASPIHPIYNSSLKRLIASPMVLSSWRRATITGLEYCNIISDDASVASEFDNHECVVLAGDTLAGLNSYNLTLDLTSARMESEELLALLSRIPSLRSLRLPSLCFLSSDDLAEWGLKTELTNIVTQNCFPLPSRFTITPISEASLPSSGTALTIYAPNNPIERRSTQFRCSDPDAIFMSGIPFYLSRIPQWRIDAMFQDECVPRHHEYIDVMRDVMR